MACSFPTTHFQIITKLHKVVCDFCENIKIDIWYKSIANNTAQKCTAELLLQYYQCLALVSGCDEAPYKSI